MTLVEVVVALVVAQVGILGVVGTLLVAVRTLERAEALEVALAAVEEVADSLAAQPDASSGVRPGPRGGVVVWSALGDSAVTVEYREADGSGGPSTAVRVR